MFEGEETEDKKEEEEKAEEKPEEKREEIKIKDFSELKPCNICKDVKIPHIEVEVDGKAEYTCKDCYEAKFTAKAKLKCPSCSSECSEEDSFCWKCGQKLQLICVTCGSKRDRADKFCRHCGDKL